MKEAFKAIGRTRRCLEVARSVWTEAPFGGTSSADGSTFSRLEPLRESGGIELVDRFKEVEG